MHSRTKAALVPAIAALLAAAALGISLAKGKEEGGQRDAILRVIPKDTMLVVTADLDALRASPLFADRIGGGRELLGVGKVDETCGFDPMTKIRTLALAIPPGDADEPGVVALGAIEAGPLVECATKVIALRGGKPEVTQVGSFTTVRDADGLQGGQIAVREGGPVLLGEGRYLQSLMGAAEGAMPNAAASEHPSLRGEIGEGAVVATTIVPRELKERVQKEIGEESAPALGITSAALSLSTGPLVRLQAKLGCDEERACETLATSFRAARDEAKTKLGPRLLGLGGVLDRLTIEAKERAVDARAEISQEEASALVDKVTALYTLRRALHEAGDRPPPVLGDESIEPRSSAE